MNTKRDKLPPSAPKRNLSYLIVLMVLAIAISGTCSTGVGDPCIPEQIPDGGFSEREAYIETSSVQCETRVCAVYKLDGDPNVLGQTPEGRKAIEDKIYCTCRCEAPDESFATCECPDDFECREVLDLGGPGVVGSYCIRQGT